MVSLSSQVYGYGQEPTIEWSASLRLAPALPANIRLGYKTCYFSHKLRPYFFFYWPAWFLQNLDRLWGFSLERGATDDDVDVDADADGHRRWKNLWRR